jgi:hypothetical protein
MNKTLPIRAVGATILPLKCTVNAGIVTFNYNTKLENGLRGDEDSITKLVCDTQKKILDSFDIQYNFYDNSGKKIKELHITKDDCLAYK